MEAIEILIIFAYVNRNVFSDRIIEKNFPFVTTFNYFIMTKSLQRFSLRTTISSLALAISAGAFLASADTMYLSHGVKTSDPVYPYTGFSTNEDVADLSVAVKLDKDMLSPYVGADITSLYIGWAGVYQGSTPDATIFLRPGLNEENTATGSVTLSGGDGWNVAKFDTPYTIKEGDELFMGYTVDMKSGVYGPCTLVWGSFDAETHFISRPDYTTPDGLPEWLDLSEPGMMEMACPLMLVAEIEVGGSDFQNRVFLNKAAVPSMLSMGEAATAGISVTNTGSNPVESITVTSTQEGQEPWSMAFDLSHPIESGNSSVITVPVYAGAKGETVLTISKVNGEDNGENSEWRFNPIVVPQATAERYTRRPLIEYFASESNHLSAAYDEGIVTPGLEPYTEKVTRINWHANDQFQLGLADDRDYVVDYMVEIAKNDSSKIYFPTVIVDRDMNLGIEANFAVSSLHTPMLGVLYSPFAEMSYEYALEQPTFAGLEISSTLNEDVVTLNISGDADLSVLPEGESLMLTVLLVEDGIESDSQEYPGGDGSGSNPGNVVHNYLVRQLLTDMWGDPISFNGDKFNATFTAYLDYDNVATNMRAVAFINRQKANGMWERNVINSTECEITQTGVCPILSEASALRPTVDGNSIISPEGAVMSVYTSAGLPSSADGLAPGIYIVKVYGADGTSATFKLRVK